MKILIAYATKTGTTQSCAAALASCFEMQEVCLCDLARTEPTIEDYDFVVVGGSIRMGMLDRRVRAFIKRREAELLKANAAYFICNGFPDDAEKYFEKNIPANLLKSAVVTESFGGELRRDKQNLFGRIIIDMIISANDDNNDFVMPTISNEAIGRFADRIKESRK